MWRDRIGDDWLVGSACFERVNGVGEHRTLCVGMEN